MQNMNYKAAFKSDFSGMSVKFSPFDANKIAFTSAANFGIVGRGRANILLSEPNGTIKILTGYEDKDSLIDCSWSEANENLLTLACGGGNLKVWDTFLGKIVFDQPSHKGDILSVENSHKLSNFTLTSGFDGFVKLWDLNLSKLVLNVAVSKVQAYQATWHPINENMFASVSGDGMLNLWDIATQNKRIGGVKAHQGEILCCDFNKYREEIVTGGIDKTIKVWDLRSLKMPVNVMVGHRYPVKKLKFSPHEWNILASGSYDMNVMVWDLENVVDPAIFTHKNHTEFVVGIDFNVFNQRQIASAGWDGRLLIWNWNEEQPKIN